MIISYSNNFVVIRTPRTGSTSLAFYFFKSGLIDPQTDIYKIEGSFASWQEFEQYISTEGLEFANLPKELKSIESLAPAKRMFSDLVAKSAISPDMPCVGAVRNPLERIASSYRYISKDMEKAITRNNGDINSPGLAEVAEAITNINTYWDFILKHLDGAKGFHKWYKYCDYFPEHAEVFNIENIHEHANKFIADRGGVVSERIELRKNADIFTPDQTETVLANLTADRRQQILDTFVKDFELWEKAYAVYN